MSTSRKYRSQGWLTVISAALLLILLAIGFVQIVKSMGSEPVSHTFNFKAGVFYVISHPAWSAQNTGETLRMALGVPPGKLELAVHSQLPGQPARFDCYPLGSTIVSDFVTAFTGSTASCNTTSNTFTIQPRDALLLRVSLDKTFTWSGTETPAVAYAINFGGIDYWLSMPFNIAPVDADTVLNALTGGFGGVLERIMPGPECPSLDPCATNLGGCEGPAFIFWTGNGGNCSTDFGKKGNFLLRPGDGFILQPTLAPGISPLPGIGSATISGTVFSDSDNNGVFNPGTESPISGRKVRLINSGTSQTVAISSTDANGAYGFAKIGIGSYTVDVHRRTCETWSPTLPLPLITVVTGSEVLTGNDLGRAEPFRNLSLQLYEKLPAGQAGPCSTATPPANQMTYCVSFNNSGANNENTARVDLALPPTSQVAVVAGSETAVCSGSAAPTFSLDAATNVVTWSVGTPFAPGDACTACVTVDVRGGAATLGDTLTATADIWLDAAGTIKDQCEPNGRSRTRTNNCAFDPNDKQVLPVGCGNGGFINRGQPLRYRVRFQNDGTVPAQVVEVTDLLDPSLDADSVRVVGTSHDLTGLSMLPDRRLVFTFDGINLPPSSSDPAGSQGFILFDVDAQAGLASGTKISNTASIVFDLNPPITTNPVLTTITDNPLPASGVPSLEVCNGIDDDCDGQVDMFATACGVGACATAGVCTAGVDSCVPGSPVAEACNGIDDDCDGVTDNVPQPTGSSTLSLPDPSLLSWTIISGASAYDVVRGDLVSLHLSAGDYPSATSVCVADDAPGTSVDDPVVLPPGGVVWYLQRGGNCGGGGSYGTPSRDTGIAAAASACP